MGRVAQNRRVNASGTGDHMTIDSGRGAPAATDKDVRHVHTERRRVGSVFLIATSPVLPLCSPNCTAAAGGVTGSAGRGQEWRRRKRKRERSRLLRELLLLREGGTGEVNSKPHC